MRSGAKILNVDGKTAEIEGPDERCRAWICSIVLVGIQYLGKDNEGCCAVLLMLTL